MNELEQARVEINAIDTKLVELFEARMNAVKHVVSYKQQNGLPILDSSREEANIARTSALLQDESLMSYFQEWYRDTMRISKAYQQAFLNEKEGD